MSPSLRTLALALSIVFSFTLACDGQDSRPKKPVDPPKAGDKAEKKPAQSEVMKQIHAFIEKNSGKIDKRRPTWRTKLPKFPNVSFKEGKTYTWKLETNKGNVEVKFLPDIAPNHVANFIYLTELGFFDNLTFHRVIPGFMAQGGCPLGTGRGNPGYRFSGEFPRADGKLKRKHDRPGLLSMANAGPGTDGSQFFLTFVPTDWLDGKHTIFGEVSSGMETLKTLEKFGTPGAGRTKEKLVITKATIVVR